MCFIIAGWYRNALATEDIQLYSNGQLDYIGELPAAPYMAYTGGTVGAAACLLDNDHLIVLGGRNAGVYLAVFLIYEISTQTWKQQPGEFDTTEALS